MRDVVKTVGWVLVPVAILMSCCLVGCGEDRPFTAQYTSRESVVITYQGKQYALEHHGAPVPAPFQYRFEEDGDLDLTLNGRVYEVESPYDVDRKKAKKVAQKKASSGKTKKR